MRSLIVLGILAAAAGPARADDPRRAAERLAADAQSTHDDAKFVACGQAYLDIYNADPGRPDNDEVLFNAASCFREGKSIGPALTASQLVLSYFPKSRLAMKALGLSALLYTQIARYDEAAAKLEEYAKRYAGEKDARDALENAILFRTALGDRARRIDDTKYFVAAYGRVARKLAADQMFALVSAYEGSEEVAALRDYIHAFGAGGGREQLAAAYGKLGDALWRASCPTVPVDGLCVKIVRDRAGDRCNATMARIVPVARTAQARQQALQAYGDASKLVDEAGLADPASIHIAAMARIARVDDDLERMIGAAFPSGLSFDGAAKQQSVKRFKDWIDGETKASEALVRAYEQVLPLKDPAASVAGAARIGQVAQAFARALVVGEISKDVRTGAYAHDKRQAYCDQMTQVAEPLQARAVAAFRTCVVKARELGIYDGWVELCRREGALADPKAFPPDEAQPELALSIPPAVEPPVKGPPELTAALATFAANDQAGWTDRTCRTTAAAFTALATKSWAAAAHYMAGLSYHRCGLVDEARRAYELAPDDPAAGSNLAELAWRAGQHDSAVHDWQALLQKNPKLFGANVNLAIAAYEQLRAAPAGDPKRKQLGSELAFRVSSALAIEDDPLPLVVLALGTVEAGDQRRLGLARLLVDLATQRDDKRPIVHVARALLAAGRGEWTLASAAAERAVAVGPHSDEALRVAGLIGVRVGALDVAAMRLAAVRTQSYEVVLARAIAARGMGSFTEAERLYQKAIQIDPARSAAHYDLGLLYELHGPVPAPERAIEEYRRAGTPEALHRAAALHP